MPFMPKDPVSSAPRFLPAMVALAALIVLAGLVSLYAGAVEPATAVSVVAPL